MAGAEGIAWSAEWMNSVAVGQRLTVGLAVGGALFVGVDGILGNWSVAVMIIGGYMLVVLITVFAPGDIVGITYDLGGVPTSTAMRMSAPISRVTSMGRLLTIPPSTSMNSL